MAKKYIDSVLNDLFKKTTNIEQRQSSESDAKHNAIITKDFMKAAYKAGLDENNINYEETDLTELADEFWKGLTRAVAAKTNLTSNPTSLGGGGIVVTSIARKTKARAASTKSLQDIKDCVLKGKNYCRPRLNKLVGDNQVAGQIQSGLSYGHGEGGGPISTLGTERGLGVIKKLNSAQGLEELEKFVNPEMGNFFLDTFNTALRDYYKVNLGWDVIRIDPHSHKAEIKDVYEISGAFVKQNPSFSKKYDLPGVVDGEWNSRFKDTLKDELYKALNQSVKNGGLDPKKLEGSPTPLDRIEFTTAREMIRAFEKALRDVDKRGLVKISSVLKKIKKTPKHQRGKTKSYKPKKEVGIKNRKKGSPVKSKTSARSVGLKNVSPIALKSLLQRALPAEIAKKMTGPPTLHYRTGRFAQSAEIQNIAPMGKSVEISYDYMQAPYSVFEPGSGSPLASIKRDPRQLIGGTIRELAQSLMGNRFLIRTKRV